MNVLVYAWCGGRLQQTWLRTLRRIAHIFGALWQILRNMRTVYQTCYDFGEGCPIVVN